MSWSPARFAALALIVTMACVTGPARAGSYHEDFSSDTFEDYEPVNRADWNTARGDVRLFALQHGSRGGLAVPGPALDVAVNGDLVYVAAGSAGLAIMGRPGQSAPGLLGVYDTPGSAMAVAVGGGRAYVADGTGGLDVLDVTNPASPALLSHLATPDTCYDVALEGSTVYLALGRSGVEAVDVSNPASPVVTSTCGIPGSAVAVAVTRWRGMLYVASRQPTLYLVQLTGNGINPLPCCQVDLGTGRALDVALGDNEVYVADDDGGLMLCSYAGFGGPDGQEVLPGSTTRVNVRDGLAVVANSVDGLDFFDGRGTNTATPLGACAVPSPANGSFLAGELVYVADGGSGVQLVTQATVGSLGAFVAGGGSSPLTDLRLYENHAYGAESDGLVVFRVTSSRTLSRRGSVNARPDSPITLDVAGTRAYVVYPSGYVWAYDVSNEDAPTSLGGIATPGFQPAVVRAAGSLVYVGGASGLRIYDFTNPASPVLRSSVSLPSNVTGLALSGKRLYAAAANLYIYDVSNPASPAALGSYSDGPLTSCDVKGNLLVVGCSAHNAAHLIDVSNPAAPQLFATAPGLPNAVAFAGDHEFVTGDYSGLSLWSIPIPSHPPTRLGQTSALVWRVAVSGERVFCVDAVSPQVECVQALQHFWDPVQNFAQSLPFFSAPSLVSRVKASGNPPGLPGVFLELSADGGNWQAVPANDSWVNLANPGQTLYWRATLSPYGQDDGTSGILDDLTIDWRMQAPTIATVRDVANDQGKQVRVDWEASTLDVSGSPTPITSYAIFRQVDPNLSVAQPVSRVSPLADLPGTFAASWDFLSQVPAVTDDEYAMVVPTLKDSTIASGMYLTTFKVIALTAAPGVFFTSLPGSGYSLDNLAPSVPANLQLAYVPGEGDSLSWDASTVPDFQYYRVYRSSTPSFTPSSGTLVQSTTSNHWIDPQSGGTSYYEVTATDFSGNESAPASVAVVTGVEPPAARLAFALQGASPNPVRADGTLLRWALPAASQASLRVYDVHGRLVRTLLDGPQEAGAHATRWDGADDAGRALGAGVYFGTLTAPGRSASRKMIVLP